MSGQSTKSSKVKRSTFHRRLQKCQVGHWVNHWESNSESRNSSQISQNTSSKSNDPAGSSNQNSGNRYVSSSSLLKHDFFKYYIGHFVFHAVEHRELQQAALLHSKLDQEVCLLLVLVVKGLCHLLLL